jgi:hypothetical protein
MVAVMTSIYTRMHDAIAAMDAGQSACEVILVGVNDQAGSAHWRIPATGATVLKFDALAKPGSGVTRAVVHNHAGVISFFEIDTSETPPADWIRGISSLRPESNAQNLRSGSGSDRAFISAHRVSYPVALTPVRRLGTPGVPKFFILDVEGMDYDIALDLLTMDDVVGIGCEHALMSSDEVILLRCTAIERGFAFEFGDEDAVFLRETACP